MNRSQYTTLILAMLSGSHIFIRLQEYVKVTDCFFWSLPLLLLNHFTWHHEPGMGTWWNLTRDQISKLFYCLKLEVRFLKEENRWGKGMWEECVCSLTYLVRAFLSAKRSNEKKRSWARTYRQKPDGKKNHKEGSDENKPGQPHCLARICEVWQFSFFNMT